MAKFTKSKVALPENPSAFLQKLWDRPQNPNDKTGLTTESWLKKEEGALQLYLNYAVTNLQELLGLDKNVFEPETLGKTLWGRSDNDPAILKAANFLWLFQEDDPERDFGKDCRKYTIKIVLQLFKLRNALCHPDADTKNESVIIDHDFYQFLTGYLYHKALDACGGKGGSTKKLYKSLANLQMGWEYEEGEVVSKEEKDRNRKENTYYLTRRGICFLLCLALYKDDAYEFCQCITDLRVKPRDDTRYQAWETDEWGELDKHLKVSANKLAQEVYTYFSYRRGRASLNAQNQDFLCFADILNYLNKVPSASLDYLLLGNERKMLADACAVSTESEENKLFKYALHRRCKERFLSLAAGACEDFGWLPAMHFKRLDVSDYLGRKRFCFGKEADTSVRLDRHFAIRHDAIRFEYRPKNHFGDIRIDALRSHVSEQELYRMMLVRMMGGAGGRMDDAVEKYFAAYHEVLERMINDPACGEYLNLDAYLPALKTVTGASEEQLRDKKTLQAAMKPFFPNNLTRFFIPPEDNIPAPEERRESLRKAIAVEIQHDKDFLDMLKKFEKWRDLPQETRPPKPQECRFTDNTLIQKVFDLLNLFLTDEHKFRQLSRGEWHRQFPRDEQQQQPPQGEKHQCYLDFEYQTLHAIIGKFPLDTYAFWDKVKEQKTIFRYEGRKPVPDRFKQLEKRRPEIQDVVSRFEMQYKKLWKAYKDSLGPGERAMPSLIMLAKAAVMCHQQVCEEFAAKWNRLDAVGNEVELDRDGKRFGVRRGLPLDRASIFKTVLQLDEEQWRHAFNYQTGKPWEGRTLPGEGHVVSQIPLANGFVAERFCDILGQKNARDYLDDKGQPDFAKCLGFIREKKLPLTLRDFYDAKCLLAYKKTGDKTGTSLDPAMPEEHPGKPENFTKPLLEKTLREIRKAGCQDTILLHVAMEYRRRFEEDGRFAGKSKLVSTGSVYDFFDPAKSQVVVTVTKGLQATCGPNDLLRPVFSQIMDTDYAKALEASFSDEERQKPLPFYDLVTKFRWLQAQERENRLRYLEVLNSLEGMVPKPTKFEYDNAHAKAEEKVKAEGGDAQAVRKAQKEAIRELLFPRYQRGLIRNPKDQKKFTQVDFDFLVELHNGIYHKGFRWPKDVEEHLRKIAKLAHVAMPPEKK